MTSFSHNTEQTLCMCVHTRYKKQKHGVRDTVPFFNPILALFHLLVYGCVRVYVFIYHIRYH